MRAHCAGFAASGSACAFLFWMAVTDKFLSRDPEEELSKVRGEALIHVVQTCLLPCFWVVVLTALWLFYRPSDCLMKTPRGRLA